MIAYVDISALMKLVVHERESRDLATYMTRSRRRSELVSSFLAHDADELIGYDAELNAAAEATGLRVRSPGAA